MKISNAAINESYHLAKRHYNGDLSIRDAVDQLNEKFGMNRNSAKDYILNFRLMIDGEVYKRCNNGYATEYLLSNIFSDFGATALKNALKSVKGHIEYYEPLRNAKLNNIRAIHAKYEQLLQLDTSEKPIISDAIDDLTAWPEGVVRPDKVKRSVESYQRNEQVRLSVLARAKGRCEFCGEEGFVMYDGRRYLETHHIIALASEGADTIQNVIAVCPKHHREAHYGVNKEALESQMACGLRGRC